MLCPSASTDVLIAWLILFDISGAIGVWPGRILPVLCAWPVRAGRGRSAWGPVGMDTPSLALGESLRHGPENHPTRAAAEQGSQKVSASEPEEGKRRQPKLGGAGLAGPCCLANQPLLDTVLCAPRPTPRGIAARHHIAHSESAGFPCCGAGGRSILLFLGPWVLGFSAVQRAACSAVRSARLCSRQREWLSA